MWHQIDRRFILRDRGNEGNPVLVNLVNHLSQSCSSVRAASSGSPVMVKVPMGTVSLGGPLGVAVLAWVVSNWRYSNGAEAWLGGGGKVVVGVMGGGGVFSKVEGPGTRGEMASNPILSLIRRFPILVMIWVRFFLRKMFDSTSGWG
jgi:hypothetical protein